MTPERFSPTLGTAFLTRISELVDCRRATAHAEMSDALSPGLDQALLGHLAQRNLSPHTRSNYGRDLAALQEFCEKQS